MNEFKRAREEYESTPIPEELDARVRAGIRQGRTSSRSRGYKVVRRTAGSVAACLAVLMAGLNVSPTFAAAAADVPVLGGLFQVLTIRDYETVENGIDYKVSVPGVESEGDLAEKVNAEIQERVDAHLAQAQAEGADISTSQPSPASLIDLWNELLKDHDSVIHIPMSSGLSSSCETAHALAADFGGKVLVVNNQRISVTQRQSVLEAKAMADQGMSAEEIKRVLEETAFDSTIYITVDTLEYLKKGGRITPAAALLGTFLKIKPVLTIQGDKLDAFA